MSTYKVDQLKIKAVNEMANDDFEKILKIFINENELFLGEERFLEHGMNFMGSGSNGCVYEFIGSDGYKYAVKNERNYDGYSDGHILEKLQGIKGYPKLFSYIEGTYDRYLGEKVVNHGGTFYIMIYQKINGFELGRATGFDGEEEVLLFADKSRKDIVEVFDNTINETFQRDIVPCDIHSHNVMFDTDEGIAYIVDVGNYQMNGKESMKYAHSTDFYKRNCYLTKLVSLVEQNTIEKVAN